MNYGAQKVPAERQDGAQSPDLYKPWRRSFLAWPFNNARESVLICMLAHAMVNSVGAGYVFPMFSGAALTRLWWIYAGVWTLAAAFLAWRAAPMLTERSV